MAVTLSKIANNTANVEVPAGDGEFVHVVYYPGHVTEKTFAQLQLFSKSDEETLVEGFGSLNSVLASLIKSWDLYEDDAASVVYPIEADRLSELPIPFRMAVLNAIMEDIRPNDSTPQTKIRN